MDSTMYDIKNWKVEKIGVIGPGIVGMPMAALLADARIKIGTDQPARVVVVQRDSLSSGWKVKAINSGCSVIGGIEPSLNDIIHKTVHEGILYASHDYMELSDADVVLVCVQTDKKGLAPDYGPLFGALTSLARVLQHKPAFKVPVIIFESTLAPSSMTTLIKEHFAEYGLIEGRDIFLGNSPNRVMPGRLVQRVIESDKLAAGLHPSTPQKIKLLYKNAVKKGAILETNSMTAEVVKTLENAYRDVRIAYAAEMARYCDEHNIDFYKLRDAVNQKAAQSDYASCDPNAVPSGGMLIPTIGVGGHCLPKDGILLWWRRIESGADNSQSLIFNARLINDESPGATIRLAEKRFGDLSGKNIALLGTAYRFNSEDTRNSPTFTLAEQLLKKHCTVSLHDPYVKSNDQYLLKWNLSSYFTNDIEKAVSSAEYIFLCTAHKMYIDEIKAILGKASGLKGVIDGCNIYRKENFKGMAFQYTGIGRGEEEPIHELVDFAYKGFCAVETGFANELVELCNFLNEHYAENKFNLIDFKQVRKLAASCGTGCEIAKPGAINNEICYDGFTPRLVLCAQKKYDFNNRI